MRNDFDKYTLKDLEAQISKTEAIMTGRNFEKRTRLKDAPAGNNDLPTNLLFEERLFYREGMYLQIDHRDIGMIDRWNTMLEYGKSDSRGTAIYPKENYLKQVNSAKDDVYGINFVVDVLEEMSDWLDEYLYKAAGGITASKEGSSITPLNIRRGWQSATVLYNDHVGELYKSFTNEYLENRHSKILIFEHFVEHFVEFCKVVSPTVPVTFSSFIESKFCPIHVNGITFEVADGDYDDDLEKWSSFVYTHRFELFRYAAQIHGFMIDKNIPWRLYANLNHPKMIQAAQKQVLLGNKPSIRNIMSTVYNAADLLDIYLLKFHLPAFYNSYIKFMPIVDTPILKTCSFSGTRLENGQAFRSPIKAFNVEGKLDRNSSYFQDYADKFWLKFYYEIKNLENGFKMPTSVIMKNTHKIMSFYDTFGYQKTIDKINTDIRLQRGKDNFRRGKIANSSPTLIIPGDLNINPDRAQSGTNYSLSLQDIDTSTGEVISETPIANASGGPAATSGGGSTGGGSGGGGGY